ncbi:type II toxin-antitoxin system RelE/ParE family toxin [Aurantimonas sp. 22II-16-19i]|uniref:type II toxin-antitoxin system RelE/ParE family toxin n=1 Tax=Aurantimonas sp. 22II-16-19i TaxID=1317114 RepID=UPI0009F7D0A4|nr:type II toxin-antitoxin system RelE/ParE family toxin [Aurantimonas sp. 22II-16-19i]ORE98546.1 plasmid stabilization system protein [Aurantimonas sp. 22II-16-19i]
MRLSDEARDFLRNEARYLKPRSPSAARRLVETVGEARRRLSSFPLMGAGDAHALVPGSRRLVIGDYVMTYEIIKDVIAITSIRHGRMAPNMPEIDDDFDFEA